MLRLPRRRSCCASICLPFFFFVLIIPLIIIVDRMKGVLHVCLRGRCPLLLAVLSVHCVLVSLYVLNCRISSRGARHWFILILFEPLLGWSFVFFSLSTYLDCWRASCAFRIQQNDMAFCVVYSPCCIAMQYIYVSWFCDHRAWISLG